MKKTATEMHLACPCGAKAAIFEKDSRWFAHCVGCGRLVFWSSPQLTERVKAGGRLCSHNPVMRPCKDGRTETSWCSSCRVRTFAPATDSNNGRNTTPRQSGR